ncbi:MAG: cytochrome [Ramlibacter sp.]|nr:cytochrome [Ramlibacter sp.]
MRHLPHLASLTVTVVLALAGAAQAQTSEALNLRSLAASCAQCHGTDGRSAPGSSVPPIAGMPRDYLAAQLKAFKAGTRPSTVMGQLAKGFSDAQLEQLADYFNRQR